MGYSIADKVLENVRLDIINSVYEPDQLIIESDISKHYNVSKTPVREALINLCNEGLLEKIPYKGYFVKSINIRDMRCLFEFRRIIECAVIELIMDKLTEAQLGVLDKLASIKIDVDDPDLLNKYNQVNRDFHIALAKMTENPYIVSTYEGIINRLRRVLIMDLKKTDINDLLETHLLIVDALKRKDLKAALNCATSGIVVIERRMNALT